MPATHAPVGYICPICLGVQQIENDNTLIHTTDIVHRDELVTVLINSFFVGNNPGHAIVVPNSHVENIYTMPTEIGHRVFTVAQQVALALKVAYQCQGITLRQNNEPAGDQHAFHFHLHVFPRYDNDGFNSVTPEQKQLAKPIERAKYARKLASALTIKTIVD